MRVFIIFILFGVLVASGLAATWFSKTIYRESINRQLAYIEKHSGQHRLRFERDVSQSGFFSFSDRVVVHFTRASDDPNVTPLAISLHNQCSVIPLYVSCEMRLDGEPALVQDIDEFLPGLTALPYQLTTSVNVLSSSINTTFTSQLHHLEGPDYGVTIKPLQVTGSASLDMSEIHTHVEWLGVEWQTGRHSADFRGLSLQSSSDKQGHDFYLGNSRVALTSFEIKDGQTRYTGNDLSMRTKIDSIGDASYGISHQIDQSALVVHTERELSINHILFSMSVNGLSNNAMRYMGSSAAESSSEKQEITTVINAFGESALTVLIDTLSARLNGEAVSASGELTIAPFDSADLQQGTIRQGINGAFRIDVEAGMAEVLPELKPMLDALLANGYVSRDEDGNFTVDLTVDQGALAANGKLLSF